MIKRFYIIFVVVFMIFLISCDANSGGETPKTETPKTEVGNNPPIVHNVYDGYFYSHEMSNLEKFEFASIYSGSRTFKAEDCLIELFELVDGEEIKLLSTEAELEYFYKKDKNYVLNVEPITECRIDISFQVSENISLGNNEVSIDANDIVVFVANDIGKGYLRFLCENKNIKLLDSLDDYIYIDSSFNKYVYLVNNSNSNVDTIINISQPNVLNINTKNLIIGLENNVMMFTNEQDEGVYYKLYFSSAEEGRYVKFFGNNNNIISSDVTIRNNDTFKLTYEFYLGAGETVYFIFSHFDESITVSLY